MRIFDSALGLVPERYQGLARQFLKFGITGTIGAVIDFSIYNILTRGFGWSAFYIVFGQPIIVANNVSTICAILSNFLINKYWTFRDPGKNVLGQWTSYFIMNVITWAMNQFLMSFFTFRVPLMVQIFGDQKDNAAKAIAIGIILFFNFAGSKLLVFKTESKKL